MLKIRLSRYGRKGKPFYRLVVTDARNKAKGAYIDNVGTYDPISSLVTIKEEAILKYLQAGAQPTNVAKSILTKNGVWKVFKANQKLNLTKLGVK